MHERALPLRGIVVFEAAARTSSFQEAADELSLTPSAVSHQIRLLEKILGIQLFDRVGRGVILTSEGAEYARSIRRSIRWLRAATNDIRARSNVGNALEVVRIEMPPSLGHCWLLPRLNEMMTKFVGVNIRINTQGGHLQGDRLPLLQSADAPADIQIVYGDDDIWADRASPLLSECFAVYYAPALLAQRAVDVPEQVLQQTVISTSQNPISWDDWLSLHGIEGSERTIGTVQLDPSHLAIEAALAGVGPILESNVLVKRPLSLGTLISPFPHLSVPGLSYWIYPPSTKKTRPAVEAVIGWLKEIAAQ